METSFLSRITNSFTQQDNETDQSSEDEDENYEGSATFQPQVGGGNLMHIMNDLHSGCRTLKEEYGIELPVSSIAVIGGQSNGKSSTLDNIGQVQLLPKGSGTVTKCPIELRFQNTAEVKYKVSGRILANPEAVERAIMSESEALAVQHGGISPNVIEVEVGSPNSPNMILVDLPGLIASHDTRKGQDENAPEKIRQLNLQHIANPKTIILVVAPAGQELQSDTAIEFAKQADPQGLRTLTVLSQLDYINDDIKKAQLLDNISFAKTKFKYGPVCVANRVGHQTFEDTSRLEAEKLKDLFTSSDRRGHGMIALQQLVGKIWLRQTQDSLPEITEKLNHHLRDQNQILEKLGSGEMVNKRKVLRDIVIAFGQQFESQIAGYRVSIPSANLSGGVKVWSMMRADLATALEKVIAGIKLSKRRMITAIGNAKGDSPGKYFLTEKAFLTLTSEELVNLKQPCLDCLEQVYNTLKIYIPTQCFSVVPLNNKAANPTLYPALQGEIAQHLGSFIAKPYEETKIQLSEYIDRLACDADADDSTIQGLWNTEGKNMTTVSGYEYDQLLASQFMAGDGIEEGNLNNAVPIDAELLEKLNFLEKITMTYLKLGEAKVRDYIPRIINCHLVRFVSGRIVNEMAELVSILLENKRELQLIREDDHVVKMRTEALQKTRILREMQDCVTNAQNIVTN